MKNQSALLAKFGKKEHIESLKNGQIYLNSIQNYRNDGTLYRGDVFEGKFPANPSLIRVHFYDEFGNDINPDEITVESFTYGCADDNDLLMFCAAAITPQILVPFKNKYILNDNFKKTMHDFGDYVLLFRSEELLQKLFLSIQPFSTNAGFVHGRVQYVNKTDYFHSLNFVQNNYPHPLPYFLKEEFYSNQNEWRFTTNFNHVFKLNSRGGYLLEASPFVNATMMTTEKFFKQVLFEVSKT